MGSGADDPESPLSNVGRLSLSATALVDWASLFLALSGVKVKGYQTGFPWHPGKKFYI